MTYYIGLMSGTSVDGIDAVLMQFEPELQVVAELRQAFSSDLPSKILQLATQDNWPRHLYAEVDVRLGREYASAVNNLLQQSGVDASQVKAIGCHGQTILHDPNAAYPVSYQIGDPSVLQVETGIPVIADFRRKDVAAGGQGAPMVPAFHQALFASSQPRVVLNIGGIANISVLKPQQNAYGYDTGPGNTLMDEFCRDNDLGDYDEGGAIAARGSINENWLNDCLAMPYFQQPPPKSTGRELFHLATLPAHSVDKKEDVLATLTELTARSIAHDIQREIQQGDVIVCGGGCHNEYLMGRLQSLIAPLELHANTVILGRAQREPGISFSFNPDFIEAMAMAFFAKRHIDAEATDLGAGAHVLGARW